MGRESILNYRALNNVVVAAAFSSAILPIIINLALAQFYWDCDAGPEKINFPSGTIMMGTVEGVVC